MNYKLFLCGILLILALKPVAAQELFDVIMRNGKVIDGTGNSWFYADITFSKTNTIFRRVQAEGEYSSNIRPSSSIF